MRRLIFVALVLALALGLTAVAQAVPAGSDTAPGKMFDRQPTPEAVVAEHIDALNDCDVDRLMAQYPYGIKILLPGGVTVEGRDDVRALFEGFCQPFPAGLAGLQFTEISSSKVHKTINTQWKAEACFLAEPYLGADAYETWAGLMAAQVTTFDGAELSINPDWRQDCGADLKFYTTAGPLSEDEIGNVLAHHHMFVELGDATPEDFLTSTPEEVYEALAPWLAEAKALGAGTFVEITPFGVGRRADIVKYVADQADLPTMMVTGIYREPFVTDDMPGWVYGASVEELADFMRGELSDDPGVGGTGVPAGIIKLSQNDTGMTLTERKILEAACMVAQETDATIASHITSGPAALAVMDALEGFGCDLGRYRFVWIHTQVTARADGATLEGTWGSGHDPGFDYLLAAAERGAYISLDGIGSGFWTDYYGGFDLNLGWIMDLVAAGYEDQIIIGADTGWYDPGYPGEEVSWPGSQDYNSILEFADWMAAEGVSPDLIQKLMHDNPWAAYSR
jgi:predicted metal-dependent phosphotriesterase family hydrolase